MEIDIYVQRKHTTPIMEYHIKLSLQKKITNKNTNNMETLLNIIQIP